MSNKFRCSFCRNEGANNEYHEQGAIYFYMCDDCDARYKEHKQLGPKFYICKCDPNNPKELDKEMGKAEIEQLKKMYPPKGSQVSIPMKETTIIPKVITTADPKKIVWETSGPIIKTTELIFPKDEPKDKPIKTRSKRKKVFEL